MSHAPSQHVAQHAAPQHLTAALTQTSERDQEVARQGRAHVEVLRLIHALLEDAILRAADTATAQSADASTRARILEHLAAMPCAHPARALVDVSPAPPPHTIARGYLCAVDRGGCGAVVRIGSDAPAPLAGPASSLSSRLSG